MKFKKKNILLGVCLASMLISNNTYAQSNGSWKKISNNWTYVQNGKVVKDQLLVIKDLKYYFDSNGVMYSNKWRRDDGKWYYFGQDGSMFSSKWLLHNKTWYYFKKNGEMVTNTIVTSSGKQYYFDENGKMVVNSEINGYKIDENGVATKKEVDFVKENGKFYHISNGKKVTDKWAKIKDKWYYFGSDGAMFSERWLKYKDQWYYFDKDGSMFLDRWLKYKDQWYYFENSGIMITDKFLDYKEKKYYFDENGIMVVNKEVKGYKINEKGEATKVEEQKNGFVNEGERTFYYKDGKKHVNRWDIFDKEWFYFGTEGEMYRNQWLYYKNNWYFFNRKGEMVTNDFVNYKGKKYYFGDDGIMMVNTEIKGYRINEKGEATKIDESNKGSRTLQEIKELKHIIRNGKKIYVDAYGNEIRNQFVKVGKRVYHIDENGDLSVDKWISKNGKWYLASEDGYLRTGFYRESGSVMRYFSIVDGEMQVNLYAYDKKTGTGYNIDDKGVGTKSLNPRQDFINMVKPYVMRVVKDKGLFPSVAIAQAALETGYGSSTLGYPPVYNLFGIKAPDGAPESEYIAVWTTEYDRNQNPYDIIDKFKKFKDYEDAFNYYANLFTRNAWLTKYYKPVVDSKTAEEAAAALTGRYATDPNYGRKLLQIIDEFDLKELDKQIYPNGVKP